MSQKLSIFISKWAMKSKISYPCLMSTNLIRFVPCEIGFKNVTFANSGMNLKDLNYETGHLVSFRSRWCQTRYGFFNSELYTGSYLARNFNHLSINEMMQRNCKIRISVPVGSQKVEKWLVANWKKSHTVNHQLEVDFVLF